MLSGLLFLLPALALALALLGRRYPGERSLLTLRRRRAPMRWPHPRSSVSIRAHVPLLAARGGLLIARSLAVRPPPVPRPAS
ncbi:MAG TPA: hypothetical protein VGL57_06710 [Solirubrobacteraceae bacterium]